MTEVIETPCKSESPSSYLNSRLRLDGKAFQDRNRVSDLPKQTLPTILGLRRSVYLCTFTNSTFLSPGNLTSGIHSANAVEERITLLTENETQPNDIKLTVTPIQTSLFDHCPRISLPLFGPNLKSRRSSLL